MGLTGTQTFGGVSAFRTFESNASWIQMDAAINHGNSGGPLLTKQGDRYWWIGINTLRVSDAPGINFALPAEHVFSSDFRWYAATKEGTATALRELYQFPTGSTLDQRSP